MAYLDSENVEDLVADIKALADETYAPKGDSILTGTAIASGADINDVVNPGRYFVANRSNYTHAPATWGSLFVFTTKGSSNNTVVQIWFTYDKLFFRYCADGTWYDWREIADTSKTVSVTIPNPLPTGITASNVTVVQSGRVVTVTGQITRDSNALSGYVSAASGFPNPLSVPSVSNTTIPMFTEFQNTATSFKKPLYGYVRKTNCDLRINGGESGTYKFHFTYIAE